MRRAKQLLCRPACTGDNRDQGSAGGLWQRQLYSQALFPLGKKNYWLFLASIISSVETIISLRLDAISRHASPVKQIYYQVVTKSLLVFMCVFPPKRNVIVPAP